MIFRTRCMMTPIRNLRLEMEAAKLTSAFSSVSCFDCTESTKFWFTEKIS